MACVFHGVENAAGERIQSLIRTHYVEIEVRFDFEVVQGVVEHGAVLPCMHNCRFKFRRASAQFIDDEG